MPGRWYEVTQRQWRTIVAVAIALGVVYACMVVYVLWIITSERPIPFAYEDLTELGSYPRQVCPGESLAFDLRVTVADAPSLVLVAENWQSVDGRTISDASPRWYVQETIKVAEATQHVSIPNLPPGQWIYERAGSVSGVAHPSLLLIPFTVPGNCPKPVGR